MALTLSRKNELRTWLELSRKNLRHNLEVFRRLSGKVTRIWVVKANAYGHGLDALGPALLQEMRKGEWLGVDLLDEALLLRRIGARCPILIMGWIPPARLGEAVRNDLRIMVSSSKTVMALGKMKSMRPIRVHLKIDTGATRQGALPEEALGMVRLIKRYGLVLEGCATHFANIEDVDNPAYSDLQIERFVGVVSKIKALGFALPVVHAACSAATMIRRETLLSAVRIGIGLYGLNPSALVAKSYRRAAHRGQALKPVLSWRSRVALIKRVPAGTPVGYGLTEKTKRSTIIAIVPVGYSDGYDRALSSRGYVLIRGKRCRVLGRVCMNMIIVDASFANGAAENDIVTLIGAQRMNAVTADELAAAAGTINYEIVSRIAEHLPRFIV